MEAYAFEISLHARPPDAVTADGFTDRWGTWPTLLVPPAALATPLTVGFDQACTALGVLERMYIEPDGAFVWASPREGPAWQVDGNLFDREGRVLLVDLKGSCPACEFDRLLEACGWPGQPVMMQLVRAAVFLAEDTFRRHASARWTVGDGAVLRPS